MPARSAASAPSDVIVTCGIQRYATHHGQAAKYHETLTRFWGRIFAHVMATQPSAATLDDVLAAFPPLLDKDLPYQHWRRETMASERARLGWVEPDVMALLA